MHLAHCGKWFALEEYLDNFMGKRRLALPRACFPHISGARALGENTGSVVLKLEIKVISSRALSLERGTCGQNLLIFGSNNR